MAKERSGTEVAAGRLISAIQKEWGSELGDPVAAESEEVMSKGHDLLNAAKGKEISALLAGRTVAEHIGLSWLDRHCSVKPAIEALEQVIGREET